VTRAPICELKTSAELTFIVLARTATDNETDPLETTKDEIDSFPMIGDVNIFLKESSACEAEAEVEVMIAGLSRK
jgi:hypothetical protein